MMTKINEVENLKNGGLITVLRVDREDFEVAGIDIEEMGDQQIDDILRRMKRYLTENLSEFIAAANY